MTPRGAARTRAGEDLADAADRHAVALNYHFVRSGGPSRFKLRAHESPQRFSAQLDQLSERFAFCRVRDLLDPARPLPPASVVLTFDDGAKDVAAQALPLLEKHSATASIFVCARPYLEGRLLDIQKIEFLMSALGVERFRDAFYAEIARRFPGDVERGSLAFASGYSFYRYDDEAIRRFKLDLNYQIPYANVVPVLDALFADVFGAESEADAVRETYLSIDELKRLVDAGFELGVHTHRHRVLPRLGYEDQKREIEVGVEFLRELTGEEHFAVAYPYGFYDDATQRAMQELGLLAGLTMERRMITPEDLQSRWSLPRYDVNDCFDKASNQMVSGVFSQLPVGD